MKRGRGNCYRKRVYIHESLAKKQANKINDFKIAAITAGKGGVFGGNFKKAKPNIVKKAKLVEPYKCNHCRFYHLRTMMWDRR